MIDHYHEEIKEHEGRSYRVRYFYDNDREAPWEDGDGRGIVIATNESADKKPGWRPLHSNHGTAWWFDWAGTIKKAEKEGWGAGEGVEREMRLAGATTRQLRERAVQNEYDFFRDYLRDEWYFVGIEVTAIVDGEPDESLQDTCWGFETWKNYHLTAAGEMVAGLVSRVERVLAERAATALRDAGVREKAREGGCDLTIYDDAVVDEVDDGYWVTAKLFVYKEGA